MGGLAAAGAEVFPECPTGSVEMLSNSGELIPGASARPGVAHVVGADHSLSPCHAAVTEERLPLPSTPSSSFTSR